MSRRTTRPDITDHTLIGAVEGGSSWRKRLIATTGSASSPTVRRSPTRNPVPDVSLRRERRGLTNRRRLNRPGQPGHSSSRGHDSPAFKRKVSHARQLNPFMAARSPTTIVDELKDLRLTLNETKWIKRIP